MAQARINQELQGKSNIYIYIGNRLGDPKGHSRLRAHAPAAWPRLELSILAEVRRSRHVRLSPIHSQRNH